MTEEKEKVPESINLGLKLDEYNYPVWSRLMEFILEGRGRIHHITGDPSPPKKGEQKYKQWREADLIVMSWLLQTMETRLMTRLSKHQTAKAIWDSLAITYGTTIDLLQSYELERDTNPFAGCEEGLQIYLKIVEQRRLFQFLSGLDGTLDGVRRDILKETPLPSAEAAFSRVQLETGRLHSRQSNPSQGPEITQVGAGFGAKGQRKPTTKEKLDRSKLVCTHCGMRKHTKEECFKLVGYPEWWGEGHRTSGKSGVAVSVAVQEKSGQTPFDSSKANTQGTTTVGGFGGMVTGGQYRRREGEGSETTNHGESTRGYQDEGDYWAWH
ncbi:Unknown protein [Striga hermonthica]|uniref:Retrotransposon Copia-like N-terminal domain-containing protein n=1 Tax=Striga hermonthica TaxID=68872 RepID=A0A9N7MNQ8_STRHE|nr:Unknown protein [Striga hermonthica]